MGYDSDSLRQDIRYALRTLTKNRGFTAVAVLTLALGIGANSAIFSVIDGLLLRPPRFEHLNRLVFMWETNPGRGLRDIPVSQDNFEDWRAQSRSLDRVAAFRTWYLTLAKPAGGVDDAIQTRGVRVSTAFFDMIGVRPVIGRNFRPEEEEPGSDRVAILGYGLWARFFGADVNVIGRTVLIDAQPYVVIGVLPQDFHFLQRDFELWMPFALDPKLRGQSDHSRAIFARLAPGASIEQAQTEIDAIARALERARPATNAGWGAAIHRLYPSRAVSDLHPALLVLSVAVGCVLLIACANVANLLLARAVAREKEIVIRRAIGASTASVVRLMLTESLLLAVIGGVVGLLVAYLALWILVPLIPPIASYHAITPTVDGRVLSFALALAIATGLLCGVVPALRATGSTLRPVASSPRRTRMGRALVLVELALSVMLLISAGLLVKSFWRLQRVDTGLRVDNVLTMQVWLPITKYAEAPSITTFYRQVLERIRALPGVQSAGAINFRPFLGWSDGTSVNIEGRTPQRPDELIRPLYRVVTPGLIPALGIQLVRGRTLTESDGPGSQQVVLVSREMVRRYWPGQDPIGKRIRPEFGKTRAPWRPLASSPGWFTVVGVVGDLRDTDLKAPLDPVVYFSYSQIPSNLMFLVLRTMSPDDALAAAVRHEVHAVDPHQPVSDVRTIQDALSDVVAAPRFNSRLLIVFALLAVILSVIGVYGATSHMTSRRTREIGMRMALGAQSRDVLLMVLNETFRLAAAGVVVGVLGAFAFSRVLSGILYGVTATDPITFAAAPIVLLAVAVTAAYGPARHAARVDPIASLKIVE